MRPAAKIHRGSRGAIVYNIGLAESGIFNRVDENFYHRLHVDDPLHPGFFPDVPDQGQR